jgi:hypothetical protein
MFDPSAILPIVQKEFDKLSQTIKQQVDVVPQHHTYVGQHDYRG